MVETFVNVMDYIYCTWTSTARHDVISAIQSPLVRHRIFDVTVKFHKHPVTDYVDSCLLTPCLYGNDKDASHRKSQQMPSSNIQLYRIK